MQYVLLMLLSSSFKNNPLGDKLSTHAINHVRPNFIKFLIYVTCFVAMARSFSDGNAICYVFPVSQMTLFFI